VPGRGDGKQVEEALRDFLDALSALNRDLNGPIPSESVRGAGVVSTDVAYAVAEVARLLREYGERAGDAAATEAAWRVDTAWLAVLAGDIDDLAQHLEEEAAAQPARLPRCASRPCLATSVSRARVDSVRESSRVRRGKKGDEENLRLPPFLRVVLARGRHLALLAQSPHGDERAHDRQDLRPPRA